MDKRQQIARYARTKEDELLLAKLLDKILLGQQRNIPASTSFLAPREQALAQGLLQACGCGEAVFFGGCEGAERCVCALVPDYHDLPETWLQSEDGPVRCIRARFAEENELSHRDFLGALMGMGIKRETVGDIYVGRGQCDLLVLREMAPFAVQNLTSAGRARLSVSEISLDQLERPAVRTETRRDTVAALRLDSVTAAGFRLSRTRAAELVASGRVTVNHLECLKSDRLLSPGDEIAVRGLGKCRLSSVDGTTKKGRLGITMERYL